MNERRTGRTSKMLTEALAEQLRKAKPVIVVAHSNDYARDLRLALHRAVDEMTFVGIRQHRENEVKGKVDKNAKIFFDHHVFE